MPVRALRAAIVAGLIAGIYLVFVVAIRGVPDRVVGWIGGPNGGIARYGGLVLRYRPPEGYDAARFQYSIERRGAAFRRDGSLLVIEAPGVSEPEANRIAALLTQGGLEFREVLEDPSLADVPRDRHDGDDYVAPGVRLDIDRWRPEDGGAEHSVPYLVAGRPDQLERAFAQLRAGGWVQPPHSVIAFERLGPASDAAAEHERWRSYLLGDEVLLDDSAVASAVRSADPSTGLPVVLLDFNRAGGERFGEVTARLVGRKLATVLGGQVKSAPVINDPIRGGRVSIAMGGGDVLQQERDADALVAVLAVVALPPGGMIEEQRWIAPAAIVALLGLATLGIGLVGGALVGLVIGLTVRAARPIWQPRPRRRDGKPAVRRILVTLLAPVALIVLQNLWLPGVNDVELDHLIGGAGGHRANVVNPASVGLAPILAAFVLVELAMLVTPRGRRARHQPGARIAIGRYVAVLGAVLAVIQSYFAVGYLDSLQRSGLEILAPGTAIHLAVMASLTAGTMLLVIVAGMIRQHGLGNGYGALILSSWAMTVVPRIVDHPTAGHALGVLTLAMIGGATMALLRTRVGGGGQASLRLPASGSVPLATASSVVPQLWFLAQLGVISASGGAARWLDSVQHRTGLFAGVIVVLVPLWSFAFSRPGVVAPLAVRAELAPPGRSTWRRATLLSLVTLLGIGVVAQVSAAIDPDAQQVCEASTAMMVAALVLDLLDDARARRAALVAVWPLHQPQHAELVRRVLWDAGIDCHLQSSHLRTLLGFFGPYAPIDVLVAAEVAPDARDRIGTLYEELPLKRYLAERTRRRSA